MWESVIVLCFCCTLPYVPSSFVIILMGKRELVALLSLSSWCLVVVVWLFRTVPWVFQQFVIVVFPDHTHFQCLTPRLEVFWYNADSKPQCVQAEKMRLNDLICIFSR